MRTVDVARSAGCSVQQVRKLEAVGVLPRAGRTPAGYRSYGGEHLACLLAYQVLRTAVGPLEAGHLLREAVTTRAAPLARLDAAHAALHQERRELALAQEVVAAIAAEPLTQVRAGDAMSVGELAVALDVRPSTLRHWESERLLSPARTVHGHRTYDPRTVRDARLVHQLRRAGYRIEALRHLLPVLHGQRELDALVAEREASIATRSGALLRATVALDAAVSLLAGQPPAARGGAS